LPGNKPHLIGGTWLGPRHTQGLTASLKFQQISDTPHKSQPNSPCTQNQLGTPLHKLAWPENWLDL